jgi:hypothetical protein
MNNQAPSQQEKKSWFRRHPVVTFLLIIFVGIPVLAGIFSGSSKTPPSSQEKKPAMTAEDLAEANSQLAVLSKDFKYTKDKFNGFGWYEQKEQLASDYNTIRVDVSDDGSPMFVSQYYGSDWIFHNQFQVKIGDTVYTSSTGTPTRTVGSPNVYESVTYDLGRDQDIMKAIAENTDKEISVRLHGKFNEDFTLSKRDKEAIQESYGLAILLDKIAKSK